MRSSTGAFLATKAVGQITGDGYPDVGDVDASLVILERFS